MLSFSWYVICSFILLGGSCRRVPEREMTISAKIIIILIFLALLMGTGSALAFLAPLPLAHALSVWGTK